ncbi:MAG: hypothetical protein NVSMB9_09720 [Isosphaeraceae bacterium]
MAFPPLARSQHSEANLTLVAALSPLSLNAFMRIQTVPPNGRMFFLVQVFMLLEAKGVVHMALLFGSTWVINSIVL